MLSGGFEASESFQGMLSYVNVWDRVLGTSQIKEMSQSCLPDEHNEGMYTNGPIFSSKGAESSLSHLLACHLQG